MSFDKNFPNRKDRRKPYNKSKRFDKTCRNHGSCGWCREDRLHRRQLLVQALKDRIQELEESDD